MTPERFPIFLHNSFEGDCGLLLLRWMDYFSLPECMTLKAVGKKSLISVFPTWGIPVYFSGGRDTPFTGTYIKSSVKPFHLPRNHRH